MLSLINLFYMAWARNDHILPRHLTYIQDGHHGPIIYDFQDPNCPYCHVMYEHEAALIQAGKLTVRYVPVALAHV